MRSPWRRENRGLKKAIETEKCTAVTRAEFFYLQPDFLEFLEANKQVISRMIRERERERRSTGLR